MTAPRKTCYYEELRVNIDASIDDIRKAHRREALRWHPDKNLDNSAEAEHRFKLIQAAYDVLSDPQERAWYDSHKESILRGGCGVGGDSDEGYVPDLMGYFTRTAYTDFNDDSDGFFATYAKAFAIVTEDEMVSMKDASPTEVFEQLPPFGRSDSPYIEVVKPFYDFWLSFLSCKSFGWKDEYDTRQAPNRMVRRLMEKDNKKKRDQSRRQYSDTVQELTKFVRKRDPRVAEYVALAKAKAEARGAKALLLRAAEREELAKEAAKIAAQGSDYGFGMEGIHDALDGVEAALDEHITEFGDGTRVVLGTTGSCGADGFMRDEGMEGFFCMACDKAVKSERAWRNHEKSKQHAIKVSELRERLLAEDANEVDQDKEDIHDQDEHSSVCDTISEPEEKNSVRCAVDDELEDDEQTSVSDEDSLLKSTRKGKKNRRRKGLNPFGEEVTSLRDDALLLSNSKTTTLSPATGEISDDQNQKTMPSKRAKGKKAKEARKLIRAEQAANTKEFHDADVSADARIATCNTCRTTFSSRTKLHTHLQATGHASLVNNKNKRGKGKQ